MKRFIALLAVLSVAAATAVLAGARQDRFDHLSHAKLFPTCNSCHAGILEGDETAFYPSAGKCAQCHDDTKLFAVDYKAPARAASNLKFTHPEHAESSGESDCMTCHAAQGAAKWMNVARAEPEASCFECHTPEQPTPGPVVHLAAGNDCAFCHVPLKDARALSQQRIADLPQPPSHKEAGFLAAHKNAAAANTATCATCHTKESCSRCHANAEQVKVIASLGSNELVTPVVAGRKAVYPKPADHARAAFRTDHGALAGAGIESCSNCHTRDSCQQCHSGKSAADKVAQLPVRTGGVGQGVDLKSRTRNAHPAGFASAHGTTAGASSESCTSCHAEKFCSECHQGADSRRFHPANFTSRHADRVYAGDGDCASCHNRESFCQSCHTGLGLNSTGKRTTTFHTGQSVWLLQHGQPARQSMESCASCHTQSSCTRCHATNGKGGWGVSPHGSMRASTAKDKNQLVCVRCHVSGTLR